MTLRVLVPLLGILATLAWGATHLVNVLRALVRARRRVDGLDDRVDTRARMLV